MDPLNPLEDLQFTPNSEESEEFDLESIIAEFRDQPEESAIEAEQVPAEVIHPAEASPVEAVQEPTPLTDAEPAEEPETEFKEEIDEDPVEEPEDESFDTQMESTIRMDLSAHLPTSEYHGADPIVEDEEAPEETAAEPSEAAEPFSEQWEPEYEQPMGDYVPPQPIQFHPQSRLKDLKKKLVSGPEHRYYKLTETGTGKLQALIFISAIIALLGIGATALYHFGLVQPDRLKLMIFGQLLAMLISALLGSHQLIEGLADLIRGRFSLKTLLIFSFVLCCADGVMCLIEATRVPCCAAFCLQVVLSLFDTLHQRRTEISQMDILRKATNLTAVRPAGELLDGKRVFLRDEGEVEDFMNHYKTRSVPEKIRSWYAIGALAAAVIVGIVAIVLHGVAAGLQVAAVTLLAAVPASFFICLSRPADILQRRFHKLGTLLCGWKGTDTAKGECIFPVNHTDLFPVGAAKMNGVKFFGNRDPDEIVAYGTALILASDNGLAPLFEQVLESRNCHHLSAQNLEFFEGGITGEVRGEPVIVGSLSFLRDMGIEIPEGMRVSQAVCVAVDGALSGLFAISYDKTRTAANGLHALCYYRQVNPMVADGDFLLTPDFICSKFGVKSHRILRASTEQRRTLSQLRPNREVPAAVLSTQQTMASLAYGISGARALRSASMLGLIVHMAGGIIGIAIMLTLVIIGATDLLTPLNVILYQLVWSIPGILLTEWTRLI